MRVFILPRPKWGPLAGSPAPSLRGASQFAALPLALAAQAAGPFGSIAFGFRTRRSSCISLKLTRPYCLPPARPQLGQAAPEAQSGPQSAAKCAHRRALIQCQRRAWILSWS